MSTFMHSNILNTKAGDRNGTDGQVRRLEQ
jgi:hypothetical protein